jgi:hypothetical protein
VVADRFVTAPVAGAVLRPAISPPADGQQPDLGARLTLAATREIRDFGSANEEGADVR